MKSNYLLAVALGGLAACAQQPPAAEPSPPLPRIIEVEGCDASKVRYAHGRAYSEELREELRQRAEARSARPIYRGQAITREYDKQRLNLELDAAEKLVRAYCG